MRSRNLRWREIFWQLWGVLWSHYCIECQEWFTLSDLEHCAYHPKEGIFSSFDTIGYRPCCNATCMRFEPFQPTIGCKGKRHTVSTSPDSPFPISKEGLERLNLAEMLIHLVGRPFAVKKEIPNKPFKGVNGLTPSSSSLSLSDQSGETSSLIVSLSRPLPLSYECEPSYGIEGEGEWSVSGVVSSIIGKKERDTSSSSLHSSSSHLTSRGSRRTSSTTSLKGNKRRPSTGSSKKKSKSGGWTTSTSSSSMNDPSSSSSSSSNNKNRAKRSMWKIDILRDDDRERMDALVEKLSAMRASMAKGQSMNTNGSSRNLTGRERPSTTSSSRKRSNGPYVH